MSLTKFLQESFAAGVPEGWHSSSERHLLPIQLERELGFSPRVDVLLENAIQERRVWIEFEISRADPAANHLKLSVGNLFSTEFSGDTFLSMVSNHVAKGRANLGAATIILMRHLGMNAFQTPLLPHFQGAKIKKLNHLSTVDLRCHGIDVVEEIQRALLVTAPAFALKEEEVYYAANAFEVSMNIKQWNSEIIQGPESEKWGKRTVRYFAFDWSSKLFAPSKFCAFLPLQKRTIYSDRAALSPFSPMTLAHYCALDQAAQRFDGGNAQKHLRKRLGFRQLQLADLPERGLFQDWLSRHSRFLRVHRDNPIILAAPR